MKRISFIGAPSGTITAIIPELGKTYLVSPDHPGYKDLKTAIYADDVEKIEELYDVRTAISHFGPGITVQGETIYYNGEPVHNMLTDRILQFMREGVDHEPLLNFMRKLYCNPSKNSVEQLFGFLERNGLTICSDGDFISYKRVKANWTDFHSGKIDYRVGQTPSMPRNMVSDDPMSPCGQGLHVGSLKFVEHFNSGGHVILMKVNPEDAVSVPHNDFGKMRVCRVHVLAEFKGQVGGLVYRRYEDLENEGEFMAVEEELD